MASQNTPGGTPPPPASASTPGATPGFSRIPSLAPNGLRSGANSRLPSPPVSPALSSPSTPGGPHTAALSGSGTWTAGMLAAARSERMHDRERRISASSSHSLGLPPAPTPSGATPAPTAPGPPSGVRHAPSASFGASRAEAPGAAGTGSGMRPSSSGYGRPPTPTGAGPSPRASLAFSPGMASAPSFGLGPTGPQGPGLAEPADVGTAGGPPGGSSTRSSIQVAVRIRPLCDKEKQRGDRVAWGSDREGNVGQVDAATGNFTAKHRFDTVFGADADNASVATRLALPLVGPALTGVNGTIFAYGVTSSGKTHTMLGTESDPGVVPRVFKELFAQMAASQGRAYSVRMSVMEIYNEVLNDLLDPTRANLKVREDARSGLVVVEGLLEQPVASAEQAMELIARGDHNRKVSATAFNEDSSRSHTITRIIVESAAQAAPAAEGGERPPKSRCHTVAVLSLIDLAGSESARAVVSKGQRMEGSFINRSLLTLGTVIHKLAAGAAGHVPFRDSKLTRLLQPSLSGAGARVAVVCNVTPAAAQSDETANTLKFAARAKLVQVTARTNEILDERTLLRRYQKEVHDLKLQLAAARRALAAAGITLTAAAAAGGAESGGGVDGAETDHAFAALGAAEASAAAVLQAERDARHAAEMESTMLRIKMARLQAFVEERGGNVDDLILQPASGAASGAATPSGPSSQRASRHAGLGGLLQLQPPSPDGGSVTGALSRQPSILAGIRHTASSPRLPGSTAQGLRSGEVEGGVLPGRSSSFKGRVSYSGIPSFGGSLSGAAPAVEGPEWSDEPMVGSAGRHAVPSHPLPASRTSAPLPSHPGPPGEAATPGGRASSASVELRAQVAAALGAGAVGAGPASASGSAGASVELDEELNEGLMAQIRDMIDEAQLASPSPDPSPRSNSSRRKLPGSKLPAGPAPRHPPTPPAGSRTAGTTAGVPTGGPPSGSSLARRSASPSVASSYADAGAMELDLDLELQVLNADREVLHDQLVASEAANEVLTAQVTDLRRQLGTYEALTRQAAAELQEIRRLKESFQARMQRENDALRAQLASLGVAPAVAAANSGHHSQLQQQQQRSKLGPQQAQTQQQQQGPAGPQRQGVHSLAPFGSPAFMPSSAIAAAAAAAAAGTGDTPTRAGPGGAPAVPTARQKSFGLEAMPSVGSAVIAAPGAVAGGGLASMGSEGPTLRPPLVDGAEGVASPSASITAATIKSLQVMEDKVKGLMLERERHAKTEADNAQLLALLQQHGIALPTGLQQSP
ncbi:hypothetical protein HYH03_005649 [Edaphochlamys debaryana]|uniref:Kinesin motor domain-containing protein n=1 Tax=Edaphochlamys debaryana TaxID=47281 RepID=A0A835Y5C0_9CHLO|nr:hypothetical protein HYH03_005649 [Edaphochlamys debaryana]|eukprot:KAG2496425.1 hypothetical protein HYH03_005649 [Edaphochlamys debaryana]